MKSLRPDLAPGLARGLAGGLAAVVAVAALGCGGPPEANVPIDHGLPQTTDELWPSRTPWPLDGVSVEDVLKSPDGANIRLIAYVHAVKKPCPVCNVGGPKAPREEVAGRTPRPRGPAAPGCLPCPDPAVTVGDEPPNAPESKNDPKGLAPRARLRVGGAAGALQQRHVGRVFFFIGVLHTKGPDGPELEVKDVRSLDER